MGVRQIFRENLKYYRKEKGLSQEKLSELIGYGGTYITEIESRHKFPKPETIDKISTELNIAPYLLFIPVSEIKKNQAAEHELKYEDALRELQEQINDLFDSKLSSLK